MRSKKVWIPVAALILLALGGWVWKGKSSGKNGGTETRIVTATEGPIEETVDATGSVSPLNRVEIKAPIQGRVEQFLVDEGAVVKRGQILAWMSSTDRAAILDAARAQGPAEIKRWEDAYKATPIVSPLTGVVILRNVVVGETVDPSTILYAVSDRLIVEADVDESDIGKVHLGMPARITLDAYPDQSDSGKVFDILYEGKNVSNVIQYGVKIDLPKVPANYRSQMTANVSFVVSRKEKAVLLPAVAVRDNPDGTKSVMAPAAEGKPAPRPIEVGLVSGDKVEIVSGLAAGDRVVISRARYSPQQAPQSSPLTMTPSRGGGGGAKGSGGGHSGPH
jgi:macrolide-specific efflux system membrane fusion protein